MGKLIFGINTTLDGCCDHTKVIGDDDIHNYFAELMKAAGTLVYGRKTYELMVPFWPDIAKNPAGADKSTQTFAAAFDGVEKTILFSRSLQTVEHAKTTIINTDLQEAIIQLKKQETKNILLGGVDLPSQLIQLNLIDEYHFVVQPLIAGEGRRMLEGIHLPSTLNLKLVDSIVFTSGSIALRYVV